MGATSFMGATLGRKSRLPGAGPGVDEKGYQDKINGKHGEDTTSTGVMDKEGEKEGEASEKDFKPVFLKGCLGEWDIVSSIDSAYCAV
jgi:hypothetical protein